MKDVMFGFIALALTGILLVLRRLVTRGFSKSPNSMQSPKTFGDDGHDSGYAKVDDEWPSIIGAVEEASEDADIHVRDIQLALMAERVIRSFQR